MLPKYCSCYIHGILQMDKVDWQEHVPRSGSCLPLCSLLSAALRRGNALCCARFRSSGWRPTSHAHRLSSDAGQLSKRAKANQALPTFIVLPRLPTKTQWSKADHQHLSSAPLPLSTSCDHRQLCFSISSFSSNQSLFFSLIRSPVPIPRSAFSWIAYESSRIDKFAQITPSPRN